MNKYPEYYSQQPDLKSNMSVEQIRHCKMFQDISKKVATLGHRNLQSMELFLKNVDLLKFDHTCKHYDIQDIALLKQSLNNQLCIKVFQDFLNDYQKIGDHEVFQPIRFQNGLALQNMTFDDFFIGKSKTHDILRSQYPKLQELIQEANNAIKKGDISHKESSIIKQFFIDISHKFLKKIFLVYTMKQIDLQANIDLSMTYLYLDKYLHSFTLDKFGVQHPNNIFHLIPNTHADKIVLLIDKGYSADQIKIILDNTTLAEIKMSVRDHLDGIVENNELNLDTQTFEILSTHEFKPSKIETENSSMGGCPFAKSKMEDGENAFKLMFKTFDEYMLKILRELESRGL